MNSIKPSLRAIAWRRPELIAASLVIVLAPLPFFIVGAALLGQDALALLAVPVSLALAWWMLRLRGERWADVGLRRDGRPLRLIAVRRAAKSLGGNLDSRSIRHHRLLARLFELGPAVAAHDHIRRRLDFPIHLFPVRIVPFCGDQR